MSKRKVWLIHHKRSGKGLRLKDGTVSPFEFIPGWYIYIKIGGYDPHYHRGFQEHDKKLALQVYKFLTGKRYATDRKLYGQKLRW